LEDYELDSSGYGTLYIYGGNFSSNKNDITIYLNGEVWGSVYYAYNDEIVVIPDSVDGEGTYDIYIS
jgi:hypothetical protein